LYFYKISLISSPLKELTYSHLDKLEIGTVVKVALRKRVCDGVVIELTSKPEFNTLEIVEVSDYFFKSYQIRLASFISNYYICSLGDAFALISPYEKCLVSSKVDAKIFLDIELSLEQNKALEFIRDRDLSLLFGDTGSGKTEIYMKLFEEMINKGKRSIFLIPEISLTPQMQIRLQNHFQDKMVVWHSKLTPKQRRETLQKIKNGDAYIIAGPRSALFAPIDDVGLIIVDEEHDESYKSSSRPRYNARDLAIYLAKIKNIKVLLGSATPSLNSYEKFDYFRLKGNHFNSKKRYIYEHSSEEITPLILDKIKEKLLLKEQTILFIPTRANYKYLICGDCGYTYKCIYCSIGMSIHQKTNSMRCHYCNYTEPIPQSCVKCGSPNLTSNRIGTAEAVNLLKERFQDATIEQFDRDSISTQAKLKKALKRFNDKKTDILVGTQMISKGHDYHSVTLAVILGMDNMLNMGDYKAREKALSNAIQIAGRSGRKNDALVLIQSFNEEFFSRYMTDYQMFLDEEKIFRKGLYPPYKKLCRVLFAHKNANLAQKDMQEMHQKLTLFQDIEIVGFGKCNIEKIANKYRYQILIRANKSTSIIKAIKQSKTKLAEIDIDPIDFS